MHFGKIIRRAKDTAPEEWSQQWMDYQHFKDILDDVTQEIRILEESSNSPINMTQLKSDELFFHKLTLDLSKVEIFFTKMQSELYNRVKALVEKKQLFDNSSDGEKDCIIDNLLNDCIHINGQLVLLEMYAHVNYCGFSKITKKHDKLTNFNTQYKFMKNKVNPTNFANFKLLQNLINVVLDTYRQLSNYKRIESTNIPIDAKVNEETKQIEDQLKDIDAPEIISL